MRPKELLFELERATEGSRELSDEMLLACGKTIPLGKKRPHPTRSLDDAVGLYKHKPAMIPSDPLKICLEVLAQLSLDFPSDPE